MNPERVLGCTFIVYHPFLPRTARHGNYFSSIPRGLRSPGPCGYFCRAAKVTKNAPEPMVLDSFYGGHLAVPYPLLRGFTDCGGDEEFRCHMNDRSSFCRFGTCRTPPAGLSKGYCLQGALGLTVYSSDSHPHRQTLVPSAARQPAPPIELCAEAQCGIGSEHGR